MNNMKQIINNHNKSTIAKNNEEKKIRLCNCRVKNECPLQGKCLQESVVYQATVTQEDTKEINKYIGITENQFKTRYNQHNSSFRLHHKRSSTALSEHIWKLKEENTKFNVTWEILEHAQPYSTKSKKCNLCLSEKFLILNRKPSLNKRKEILSWCMHRNRHLLQNFKTPEGKRKQP